MKRPNYIIHLILILFCMGLSSRAFADYTALSDAIMGTSNFSTTTNNWTIGSNISTTTTSSSKYAVYNTSDNITGSTTGRVTGTIAIIINVPETTTAQEIFSYTYISGTTSTTTNAVGLGINASRQLVGYWGGSQWSSTSTIDISAGKHIVVFKTGNSGSFIYVDNSSNYIQMNALRTTATGKNGFEFEFTDYIKEFYCFDSDIDAGNLFNALTSYTITCDSSTGGSIEASSTSARPGTTITLSNTPDTGYELSALTVKDASDNEITVTDNIFTMPASNVTVTATFAKSVETITPTADQPYAIKYSGGNYVNTEVTVTEGGNACATLQAEGTPFVFASTSTTGVWTIQNFGKTTYLGAASWCTVSQSSTYDWTIVGANDEFTMARTDGKFVKVGTSAVDSSITGVYSDSGTAGTFSIVPMYSITTSQTDANGTVGYEGNQYKVEGAAVTLTNTPNTDYILDAYSVTDANGKAVTVTNGTFTMPASSVTVSATFKANPVKQPTFSPTETTFDQPTLSVTLSTTTDGATIYYTTDETDPTSSSTRTEYTGAFTISGTTTIKAAAYVNPTYSTVATMTYTQQLPSSAVTYTTTDAKTTTIGSSITAATLTASGYNGTVTYSSSDTSIATVSADGTTITAIGKGYAKITATAAATDSYLASTAVIGVNVKDPDATSDSEWEGQPITDDMLANSTTITDANTVYLYNKANGLYLNIGGHWGVEGLLTTTPLSVWLNGTLTNADLDCIKLYSKSDESKWWGWISPAMAFENDTRGFFCDASDNYKSYNLEYSFTYDSSDKSYIISPKDAVDKIEISYVDNGVTKYLADVNKSLSWINEPYSWAYDNGKIYTFYNSTSLHYLSISGTTLTLTTTETTLTVNDNGVTDGTYYIQGGSTTVSEATSTAAKSSLTVKTDSENYYLTYQNDGSSRSNIVTVKLYDSEAVPDEARWLIVTKKDFIEKLDNASEKDATQVDVSYKVVNPSILRNETQGWTSNVTAGTIAGGYFRIGNSLFATAGPTETVNGTNSTTYLENAEDNQTTTYGGNGSGYTVTDADAEYTSVEVGKTTWYNDIYGGYYSARLFAADGKAYQQISGLKAGWYKVVASAYVFKTGSANVKAYMYAKDATATEVGSNYATAELMESSEYKTMTDAAIMMANSSDYTNSVMVYIEDTDNDGTADLEIGFTIAGGTLSGKTGTSSMLGFDNVQLYYCGNASVIVLDEDWTDVDNISKQISNVTKGKARTLALRRKISDGVWNSLVLPVSINAQSLKTAFGEDVKLCEFDKAAGHVIYFKNVDLSISSNVAIEPGKIYIVKPQGISSGNKYTEGTWTGINGVSVEANTTIPVFLFNQTSMDEYVSEKFSDQFETTTDDYPMVLMGSYVSLPNEIIYGSYVINAANGKWVHWVPDDKTRTLAVKGFRGWISPDAEKATEEGSSDDSLDAKVYSFVIDGANQDAVTEIRTVDSDASAIRNNNIYTINGQMINADVKNLNSLRKGIYIINGSKYIVK